MPAGIAVLVGHRLSQAYVGEDEGLKGGAVLGCIQGTRFKTTLATPRLGFGLLIFATPTRTTNRHHL